MNAKIEYAKKILQIYGKENGVLERSTSDLSPLELWLLEKLYLKYFELIEGENKNEIRKLH